MNTRPAQALRRVSCVVIGAGHAGLAVGHWLNRRGIDHLILERDEVASAWTRQRWDSLRLLTPNWQSALPGQPYRGDDPQGFMRMPEVAAFIRDYAHRCGSPVETHTEVQSVRPAADGFRLQTSRGFLRCRTLVLASGAFARARVPALDAALPDSIERLTPHQYRNPAQLAPGGVLVVGAAATGVQIADELRRAGRRVILACGEHLRLPRRYRGLDIQDWMHRTGLLDETWDTLQELQRLRRLPSPQLIGTPEERSLDLNSLREQGVELVGRLAGVRGRQAQFSGALSNATRLADLKQDRLLDSIDEWIEARGLQAAFPAEERPAQTRVDRPPRMGLDLASGEIRSVLWATGFRPDYHWLQLPVFDRRGELRHRGGIVDYPGLYVMGLPFMRRRKSSFIFGAADDARDISAHLAAHLADARTSAACA